MRFVFSLLLISIDKPADDSEAVGDPYKTLFISRPETDLRREFESYGNIERVRIVCNKRRRSRGYAFIVLAVAVTGSGTKGGGGASGRKGEAVAQQGSFRSGGS